RREDDVVEMKERRVRGGFTTEHIEPGARDPAGHKRLVEGRPPDQPTAPRGGQKRGWLHEPGARGVHETVTVRRSARAERDEVGFGEELLERGELDAVALRVRGLGRDVMSEDAHLESAAAPCHGPTDPAEPDDPDRRSPESRPELPAPAAGRDALVVDDEV